MSLQSASDFTPLGLIVGGFVFLVITGLVVGSASPDFETALAGYDDPWPDPEDPKYETWFLGTAAYVADWLFRAGGLISNTVALIAAIVAPTTITLFGTDYPIADMPIIPLVFLFNGALIALGFIFWARGSQ